MTHIWGQQIGSRVSWNLGLPDSEPVALTCCTATTYLVLWYTLLIQHQSLFIRVLRLIFFLKIFFMKILSTALSLLHWFFSKSSFGQRVDMSFKDIIIPFVHCFEFTNLNTHTHTILLKNLLSREQLKQICRAVRSAYRKEWLNILQSHAVFVISEEKYIYSSKIYNLKLAFWRVDGMLKL